MIIPNICKNKKCSKPPTRYKCQIECRNGMSNRLNGRTECQNRCQKADCQYARINARIQERMSEYMPESNSNRMYFQMVCQKLYQNNCQGENHSKNVFFLGYSTSYCWLHQPHMIIPIFQLNSVQNPSLFPLDWLVYTIFPLGLLEILLYWVVS